MAAFSPIVCTFIFLKVEFSFVLSFSVVVLRLAGDEMFFASFSAPFPFRCSPSYKLSAVMFPLSMCR